jgi:pentatricopeptide repeat protein
MVHSYGQQQMMDKMEALVERMRADPGLGLDNFTHSAVVAAWSRAGRVDKALEAFDSIAATGGQPSLHAWTAILHMLGTAGRSDEMLRTLDKMKRLGVKPSTAVYNTIINAFGKARNIHSMMDTFKAMRRFVRMRHTHTHNTTRYAHDVLAYTNFSCLVRTETGLRQT